MTPVVYIAIVGSFCLGVLLGSMLMHWYLCRMWEQDIYEANVAALRNEVRRYSL